MPFFGLRASDDFTVTGQRPQSWREMIMYLYPNGDAPLTALLAMMKSESVDDPHFHWFTKTLPTQRSTIVGVYTDSGMSSAYVTGGNAGDTLYVKIAANEYLKYRKGHQVLLRDASDPDVDVNATITADPVDTKLTVMLLEDDDNSSSNNLSDADTVLIIGNSNAEGALIPDSITYDPTEHDNYTQIFRTPLDITRTARKTHLRTGDAYKTAKKECLEIHSIEQEKAYLWGVKYLKTGANGKPERFTQGLIPSVRAGANVSNYTTDSDFTSTTWLNGGEAWLDKWLEQVFRYGKDSRMAFVGSGAVLAINKLVKNSGQFQFTPKTVAYGIKVMEWVTPFGVLYLKRHPLFSYEETNRNSMVIFDPTDLVYRYIDDTSFYADGEKQNTGHNRYDGTKEEFLTEAGLEFHFPVKTAYLSGFGSDA